MDREKRIKLEIEKLNKIFCEIPENKKELVGGLIQNAAFMAITLEDLQKEVVENGAMIPYTSGNGFETIRDNPAQKAYTTMIARYSNIIQQLGKELPSGETETDELMDFINNN